MKELEKTKRISISAVLFLLVIIAGLLTIKRPKTPFKVNADNTLIACLDHSYMLSPNDLEIMDTSTYTLIDIRNNLDYTKGHYKDAINVQVSQFLEDTFINLIEDSLNEGKMIILYGRQPHESNNAWMLLYQLGFDNIRILSAETHYNNDHFNLKEVIIESPELNYAETMEKAKTNPVKKIKSTYTASPKKKKVVTKPKKKKRIPEGGC